MLDHLRIVLPVLEPFYKSHKNRHTFVGDLLDLDLNCASRRVAKDEQGRVTTGELFVPYESLPSSYTDMAFKFYNETMNIVPHVEIKASPLKLLQGHNVYGFDDIELGAFEMLGLLAESYPKLNQILDYSKAEVLHLDTTFFARLQHQRQVQPTLDYLARCSSGHRKTKQVKYDNYVTWGSKNARFIRPKAYGKFEEVKKQIDELHKYASMGCQRSKKLIEINHDVLGFANACTRFEARVCKKFLIQENVPTNLWDLIRYQKANPDVLTELWHKVFDPILATLKGKDMTFATDDELYDLLVDKLKFTTPKGNESLSRANNAWKLYEALRSQGFEKAKDRYKKTSFYRDLNSLLEAGISKAHLQNLHVSKTGKVIPFCELVQIKFDEQLPPNYVKPTSKYMQQSAA